MLYPHPWMVCGVICRWFFSGSFFLAITQLPGHMSAGMKRYYYVVRLASGWLAGWLAGCLLVDRQTHCWLAGWLLAAGWLAGWLPAAATHTAVPPRCGWLANRQTNRSGFVALRLVPTRGSYSSTLYSCKLSVRSDRSYPVNACTGGFTTSKYYSCTSRILPAGASTRRVHVSTY